MRQQKTVYKRAAEETMKKETAIRMPKSWRRKKEERGSGSFEARSRPNFKTASLYVSSPDATAIGSATSQHKDSEQAQRRSWRERRAKPGRMPRKEGLNKIHESRSR